MYPQIQPDALINKIILITGAGDGIGRAAAVHAAAHGATVILLGKTVKKLEAVYDEIVAAGHPEPAIVPMDLQGATLTHYQGLNATIMDQFGRLDGLLLNAGILGKLRPFEDIPQEEWANVMQVNVTSNFLMVQALLPALEASAAASVVFTTSSVGRKGRAFWGSYAVSKFAVEGLMQTLADEFSNSTMRFNAINPGATRTAMRSKAYPAENAEKLPTADEIMPLYLYLLSDISKDQNGQSLNAQ
ncbi:YciK family oxidoreductase [Bowmanella sp. JS7-9]|uniref:YciK family oxidoreductase n=1 Tax=Pseudobowmanella zhangzhouensis TaxID=1537679 RepID=A0ABW1XM25_9ALTE|nr:YciK family oxidoreductase [Bowmanella sp. JS7-9]